MARSEQLISTVTTFIEVRTEYFSFSADASDNRVTKPVSSKWHANWYLCVDGSRMNWADKISKHDEMDLIDWNAIFAFCLHRPLKTKLLALLAISLACKCVSALCIVRISQPVTNYYLHQSWRKCCRSVLLFVLFICLFVCSNQTAVVVDLTTAQSLTTQSLLHTFDCCRLSKAKKKQKQKSNELNRIKSKCISLFRTHKNSFVTELVQILR